MYPFLNCMQESSLMGMKYVCECNWLAPVDFNSIDFPATPPWAIQLHSLLKQRQRTQGNHEHSTISCSCR